MMTFLSPDGLRTATSISLVMDPMRWPIGSRSPTRHIASLCFDRQTLVSLESACRRCKDVGLRRSVPDDLDVGEEGGHVGHLLVVERLLEHPEERSGGRLPRTIKTRTKEAVSAVVMWYGEEETKGLTKRRPVRGRDGKEGIVSRRAPITRPEE